MGEVTVCGREVTVCGREVTVCGREVRACGREVTVCGREVTVCGREVMEEVKVEGMVRIMRMEEVRCNRDKDGGMTVVNDGSDKEDDTLPCPTHLD